MNWKSDHIKKGGYTSYLNGKYHQFQGYEKVLEELKNSMDETLEYAEKVEDQNKALKDEHWKDERMVEMKERLKKMEDDYYRGFPISAQQSEDIEKWMDQHWTNKHAAPDLKTRLRKQGAIGGTFEYRFVPTSIGTSGTIICPSCQRKMKEELGDTSDYKSYGEYRKREKELIEKYDCEFEFQEVE